MKIEPIITKLLAIQPVIILVKAQGARFSASCGLFDSTVFCFGGSSGTLSDSTSDSQMFKLNLTQTGDIVNYKNYWQLVNPITNNVVLAARSNQQTASISDTQLLVSGGYTTATHKLDDQSIVFDITTSTWSSYANYAEGDYGNREIYFAASTFVPGKGAAFYGGYEEYINTNWTISTTQNLTTAIFSNGTFRAVGYTGVAYLDITNPTNVWSVPSPQLNAPAIFSAVQSSIFYPKDNKIYYFGGTYLNTSVPSDTVPAYKTSTTAYGHSFTYALTFDTTTNTWGNQTLQGSIPGVRKFHTTNILPVNNNSTVLLYGGEYPTGGLVPDSCFTLDMDTFTWTSQSIVNTLGANMLRSRHSVIEVNNSTLLIMFGLDSTQSATDELIALNISDPNSISYMSYFPGINPALNVTNVDSDDDSNNLGTGAIAGIGVGAGVAVVGGLALAIFCFFKRRRGKQRIPEDDQNNASHIDVNWDEIEKHYSEIPPLARPDGFFTDESGTVYNNSSEGNISDRNYNSSSERINNHNQIVNKPHVENQPTRTVLKPDININ